MKNKPIVISHICDALREKISSLQIRHQEMSENLDAMRRQCDLALADSTRSSQQVLELEKQCKELICRRDQINSDFTQLSTEQAEVSAGIEVTVHSIARLSSSLSKCLASTEMPCPPGRIVTKIPVQYCWALEYDLCRFFLIHLSRLIRLTQYSASSEVKDKPFYVDLSNLFESKKVGAGVDACARHPLGELENNFLILLQIANTLTPNQKSLIFDSSSSSNGSRALDEATAVRFEFRLY